MIARVINNTGAQSQVQCRFNLLGPGTMGFTVTNIIFYDRGYIVTYVFIYIEAVKLGYNI